MVRVLASSVVNCECKPHSGQTKYYKISFAGSSLSKVLRSKNKDWLAQNQDNVSQWANMSIHGLLSQWAGTIKIQLEVLV
jgi:hypothetical protein